MGIKSEEPTNGQRIYQTILDLHAAGRTVSRQAIWQILGIKLTIVDDHIKRLREQGKIRMVFAGVFEPVDSTPDRAVSWTFLPDGRSKLEIGDTCIELTLREAMHVGMGSAGIALRFGR